MTEAEEESEGHFEGDFLGICPGKADDASGWAGEEEQEEIGGGRVHILALDMFSKGAFMI